MIPFVFPRILFPIFFLSSYYRERGSVFVYIVSPSKAAHLPEHFLDRVSCPSTPAARAQLVPRYVNALKRSGINILHGAGLIHALKGRYEVDLFPQGREHWNDLGGALVVSALVKEINARAGREIVPPFTFTHTMSRPDRRCRSRTGRSAQRVLSAARLSDAEGELRSIYSVRARGRTNAGPGNCRQQFWPSAREYSDRAQLPLRSQPLLLCLAGAVPRIVGR
jgi:hypothetical protein